MPPVVEARNLVKKYQNLTAVDSINFQIEAGESFGFLGPNGAGKTSTIKMMGCVSPVSGGSLFVLGQDVTREPRAIKEKLGVVPQRENLDPDLTVGQNLIVYARYFNIPRPVAQARSKEVLELFNLQDRIKSPIATLSDGMKHRLLIARALINQPSILFLDEPTTGLDPQARLLVWQKLSYLQSQGITIVLSTHNMEEASQLCNRLIIMHLGKILAEGAPAEMVKKYVGKEVLELRLSTGEKPGFLEKLKQSGMDGAVSAEVGDTLYFFDRNPATLGNLTSLARQVVQRQATLEDVFFKLTGKALEE